MKAMMQSYGSAPQRIGKSTKGVVKAKPKGSGKSKGTSHEVAKAFKARHRI